MMDLKAPMWGSSFELLLVLLNVMAHSSRRGIDCKGFKRHK